MANSTVSALVFEHFYLVSKNDLCIECTITKAHVSTKAFLSLSLCDEI